MVTAGSHDKSMFSLIMSFVPSIVPWFTKKIFSVISLPFFVNFQVFFFFFLSIQYTLHICYHVTITGVIFCSGISAHTALCKIFPTFIVK